MGKRGWLCMVPEQFTCAGVLPVTLPTEVLAVLCIYRTKKAARAIHGPKVLLRQVELPDQREGIDARGTD